MYVWLVRQPAKILADGTVVRTSQLDGTAGFLVKPKHLAARQPDTLGVIVGIVGGHGGDVYWVQHEGADLPGAYLFTEFELSDHPVIWAVTFVERGVEFRSESQTFKAARSNFKRVKKLGMTEVRLHPPVFENREAIPGPCEVKVERRSAWDRLQDDGDI